MLYRFLDIFFYVFHSALILFNIFGWMWRKTRLWNMVTLGLTGFSWFVLGIWHGWGYCFCTDWHWEVRKRLGYFERSESYIQFLLLKLTGTELSLQLINMATAGIFFISLMMSVSLNVRDKWKK